jgi:hypothetical protein
VQWCLLPSASQRSRRAFQPPTPCSTMLTMSTCACCFLCLFSVSLSQHRAEGSAAVASVHGTCTGKFPYSSSWTPDMYCQGVNVMLVYGVVAVQLSSKLCTVMVPSQTAMPGVAISALCNNCNEHWPALQEGGHPAGPWRRPVPVEGGPSAAFQAGVAVQPRHVAMRKVLCRPRGPGMKCWQASCVEHTISCDMTVAHCKATHIRVFRCSSPMTCRL